ncbi:phosphate acetyltransferase [Candidatus Woesearchaeota archaeon]|nr:phosphate acetyltransferase [Candidatus Woesearchaeota archaeon]
MKYDLIPIMEKIAKKKPVKVVVCEGWDERVLKAVDDVLKKKLAEIILLGNPEEIKKKAEELKVDISKAEIHDFKNSELKDELIEKLVEARKHKGMTKEQASELIQDENYFGCMYCYAGYSDAAAGSAIGSTAELMRPALQILREKGRLVSEVCVFTDVKNNRTLFGTDFSLNIDPSAEDLAQMTLNAADCVRGFGIEPKIALLSYSTKGSGGDSPDILKIRQAADIVKKQDPKLIIDGELQVDAAVSRFGAKKKCPDSPLKGDANTLIFPNLTASNIFAHGIGQFSDMTMDLTILVGLAKPVGILGRSTPVESVRNIIISCAMQVNVKR